MSSFKKNLKKLKKLNPLSNKVKLSNDVTLKWKIKNPQNKEKCSIMLKVNKKYEDVEFFAMVDGKPFLINENGIGTNFNEGVAEVFSAKIGMTKKI